MTLPSVQVLQCSFKGFQRTSSFKCPGSSASSALKCSSASSALRLELRRSASPGSEHSTRAGLAATRFKPQKALHRAVHSSSSAPQPAAASQRRDSCTDARGIESHRGRAVHAPCKHFSPCSPSHSRQGLQTSRQAQQSRWALESADQDGSLDHGSGFGVQSWQLLRTLATK